MARSNILEVKRVIAELRLGRGEAVRLMREVAHDGTILCLSQLRRSELDVLLERLQEIAEDSLAAR